MEITEDIIVGSIIKQLKDHFGNTYKYYDTLIEEGFIRPSFYVYRVNDIHKKQYTGSEYRFKNDNYIYVIRYFPTNDRSFDRTGEINSIIDDLKEVFEYLEIVNITPSETEGEDPTIDTQYNHINNIEINVVDNVLQFQIEFDLRTVKLPTVNKVEENILTEELK